MDLSVTQKSELIQVLQKRFEDYMERHEGLQWADVQAKIDANTDKLRSLYEMETTGGEPDVVGYDAATNTFVFYDCSIETPKGRRSLCYDQQAMDSRKENKPENSAIALADAMHIALLTQDEYRHLQTLGHYDIKTSSWILTPPDIRALGGALFADYRYGHVFVYHNGAESYYAVRGFRGSLHV